jgi:hypothetical protein
MNVFIDSQESLWAAVRASGEPWERIVYLKQIIHPLFYINSDLPLSDPNHPGNLYGKANELSGNATRLHNKIREIIGENIAEYSSLLDKLFENNADSDSDDEVQLSSYTANLIHRYMEYIATLSIPTSQ